jgi:alpha-beta hydrolase superfamily lysophospholipase
LDTSTDALIAERNMRATLREAGNKDVTLKIFPNANHALLEMPSANRMAPDVFATLRTWLARHIRTSLPDEGD